MANNRMILVYRPTGQAVYLGKRLGDGWYDVPHGNIDDFCLAMEISNSKYVLEYNNNELLTVSLIEKKYTDLG